MAVNMFTQDAPPKATAGIRVWSILRHPSSRAEPLHGGHLRKTGQQGLAVPSLTRDLPGWASPPACDRREASKPCRVTL